MKGKKVKIIKTFILKFPIFTLNWSGYGENEKDYVLWEGLDAIDYNQKFENCIESMRKNNLRSDLSVEITEFVKENFNRKLLFSHSLHPTNILQYQLWKQIFKQMSIEIMEENFLGKRDLLRLKTMINPFTKKMIKDLDIHFAIVPNDKFYLQRYERLKGRFKK